MISADGESVESNQGTARRFNYVADLVNLRADAKTNVCVFRSVPREFPFVCKMLERHPFSSQMFVPMNAKRYLVLVSLVRIRRTPERR